jgi:hypothetical protein
VSEQEMRDIFDRCLNRYSISSGVGAVSVSWLINVFSCMRVRLKALNATDADMKTFVAAITHAIESDPALARKQNNEQRAELLRMVPAVFAETSYTPSTSLILSAEVNFLKRVQF